MGLRKKRGGKSTESLQKRQQVEEYQPTILKKPEIPKIVVTVTENEEKKEKVVDMVEITTRVEPPAMKHSVSIIKKNHIDSVLILEKLDVDNANFYVVGAIGMKDSGKSTLLNLIATGERHQCKGNQKLTLQAPLFSEFTSGFGVEGFITESRLILLDSSPVLYNMWSREFLVSEADDIRQVQSLLQLCHELVIVYEPQQIMSLVRMLLCAHGMMNPTECKKPRITLMENRVRPGASKHPMTDLAVDVLLKSKISDSINSIQVLDFNRVLTSQDPMETIAKLRDEINTRKELKAQQSPTETEKTWWEKLSKMKTDGGLLLTQFENLREKYYQPTEHWL